MKGTGVALVTPFSVDGTVDQNALASLVNYMIDEGVDYLVALGTTAETATLTSAEKKTVRECIVKAAAGRVPLVLGMGGNNTAALVEEIKATDLSDFSALLSVCPYYNRPNQRGLYAHFEAVSNASSLPIILYNVPSRTGGGIANDTVLQLAKDFENIIGIKDASGDLAVAKDLIARRPKGFYVLSGDDDLAMSIAEAGGEGVISVLAGGVPKTFTQMMRAALAGNSSEALSLHQRLSPLMRLIFEEGNPAGIKAVLHQNKRIENRLRLPLVPVSEVLYSQISAALEAL